MTKYQGVRYRSLKKLWKLFFCFPKKEMDSQGSPSFLVQNSLVRCGFQSPATQVKLFQTNQLMTKFKIGTFRS